MGSDSESACEEQAESSPSGRYIRYNSVLGKGAYKTVYKAFDTEEALEVAWNKLHVDRLSEHDLEKVSNEVSLLRQVEHKNIIHFYDTWRGEDANGVQTINFITEQMMSGTLKEYLKKAKAIKLKVIRRWCRNILEAIAYLHSRIPPIMHRDLKCDNIFINGHVGEVKIGDLGLSGVKDRDKAESVIGTPEFMAPELYEESYTEKVDIYAFGMCLLEMVTMEYPYSECNNMAQIFKKVFQGEKPRAFSMLEEGSVKDVINACLQREEHRPSASRLLEHPLFKDWEQDDGKASNLSLVKGAPIAVETALSTTRTSNPMPIGTELIDWSDPLNRNVFVSMIGGDHAESHGQQVSVVAAKDSGGGGFYIGLEIPIRDAIKRVEFTFDPFEDSSQHIAQEMVAEFGLNTEQLHVIRAEIDRQVLMAKEQREAASRNATPQPPSRHTPAQTVSHNPGESAAVATVPQSRTAYETPESLSSPSETLAVPPGPPQHSDPQVPSVAMPTSPGRIERSATVPLIDELATAHVEQFTLHSNPVNDETLPFPTASSHMTNIDPQPSSSSAVPTDSHFNSHRGMPPGLPTPTQPAKPLEPAHVSEVLPTGDKSVLNLDPRADHQVPDILHPSLGNMQVDSAANYTNDEDGSLRGTGSPVQHLGTQPLLNLGSLNSRPDPPEEYGTLTQKSDCADHNNLVSFTSPTPVVTDNPSPLPNAIVPSDNFNDNNTENNSQQPQGNLDFVDAHSAERSSQPENANQFGALNRDSTAQHAQSLQSLSIEETQQKSNNPADFGFTQGHRTISEAIIRVTPFETQVQHSASDSQLQQSHGPQMNSSQAVRPPSTPMTSEGALSAANEVGERLPDSSAIPQDSLDGGDISNNIQVKSGYGKDSNLTGTRKSLSQERPRPPSVSIPKIVVVASDSNDILSDGRQRRQNDSSSSATDVSGESSRGGQSRGASGEHTAKNNGHGKSSPFEQKMMPVSGRNQDGRLGEKILPDQSTPPTSGQMSNTSWRSTYSLDTTASVTSKVRKDEDGVDLKSDKYLTKGLKLMDLCARGRYADVKNALLNGSPVTYKDYDKRTPLHVAAGEGHRTVCALLIESGSEIAAKDRWGNTALSDAQENGHVDVVELLKQHGAEDEITDIENLELMHYCAEGNLEYVRNRISGGANASFSDYDKRTPMHLACSEGHVEITELLLVNGASFDAIDRKRRTPVDDAISNGRRDVLRLLKRYGAKVPNHLFETDAEQSHRLGGELMDFCAKGNVDGVRECLDHGADANFKNFDQRTPLHLACVEGYDEIVEILLAANASLNSRDRWNSYPADDARDAGYKHVIEKIQEFELRRANEEDIPRSDTGISFSTDINGHGGRSTDLLGFHMTGGISLPALQFSADDFADKFPLSAEPARSVGRASTTLSLPRTPFDSENGPTEDLSRSEHRLLPENNCVEFPHIVDGVNRMDDSHAWAIDSLKSSGVTNVSGKVELGDGARHSVDGSFGMAMSGVPRLVEQIGLGVDEGRDRGQVPCSSSMMSLTAMSNGMGEYRGGDGGMYAQTRICSLPTASMQPTNFNPERDSRMQNTADMAVLVDNLVKTAVGDRIR